MAVNPALPERPHAKPPAGGTDGRGAVETLEMLEAMLDALPAQVALLDDEGVVLAANRCWKEDVQEEHRTTAPVGANYPQFLDEMAEPCRQNARLVAVAIRQIARRELADFSLEYRKPGEAVERWVRVSVMSSRVGGQAAVVVRQLEITAEKSAAARVERLNRLYAVCSGINAAIVRIHDASALYQEACRIAVEEGRLVMAWVGLHDAEHARLVPAALWGRDEGYLGSLQISTSADEPSGQGPAGTAFRTGSAATCNDIAASASFASRAQALARGYRSCAAFPLRVGRKSIGVFVVYSAVADCFDTDELALLQALTQNLSLAIEAQRDVQRRRQAELNLRATEASMAVAQEVGSFGSWQLDLGNRAELNVNALRWSEQMFRIAGYEPGEVEVTNELFFGLTHPADREMITAAVDEAIRDRKQYSLVHRIIRPDGDERVIHEAAQIVFDERTGEPLKMVGTAHDITEQRRALEKIQQGQALLRMAERVARVGAWAVDLPGYAVTLSDEVRAIHGMPPGYALPLEEGLGFYAPEDRPTVTEKFMRCATDAVPFDLEVQIITMQGQRVWVRVMAEAELNADCTVRRVQGAFQDISERKRAEAQTRQLSERLTRTLEIITDAFFTLDRGLRMTYANRAAERIWGRQREDLLGKVCWDEFPTMVGTVFQTEVLRALKDNVVTEFEAQYEPLASWFHVRCFPSEEGLAVYFRDVTQERGAHEALRASEERFRLLSKATNDAIWDWDLLSNLVWWNEGFEALFGYARSEIEPDFTSWTKRIHPDDLARVAAHVDQFVEGSESVFIDEYRFRRKDGRYAYVLDRGHVLRDAEGKALRMIGGMTDLTERMLAEERIAEQASLLDQTRDAIVVRDLEHRVNFWNKGAERLYGWTAAEAIGKVFSELVKAQPVKFGEANESVHAKGEWQGELQKIDKGGRKRVLDCRWTLLRGKDGQARSILSIATDITEKKKIEMQFLRAQRMESIGTLAGGIAHDLNNVLAPILMSIEWLQMHFKDPEADRMLETIASSAERGAQMVRQVLSFARGIGGERIPIQPKHLLQDLQRFIYDTFPRNIDGRFKLDRELGVILGDPTQVYQVLLNLCVNARDAMPNGGVLTVRAKNQTVDEQFAAMEIEARAGQFVLFEVEDTGTGISPENLDKIFDPFFTTKAVGKGTGLGLSTTQAIVKSHHGFIRVNSEPGHGSRFQVYLPAETRAEVAADGARPGTKLPRGKGQLILVVDDETNVREITRMTLEGFGYRALTAENGVNALALVAMHRGEIAGVLTDMMMPVMDGPALIAALKKMAPELPVIAASGVGTERTRERATEAGAKHFLPKPYTAETLLGVLAGVLG